MSQHDYVIADAAGAAFLADLNLALPALASLNSGATAPATTYAYMPWADTASGWLKQRNAANSAWIHVAPLGTRAWVDVASATTLDLDANAANSDKLRITGTTATTAITLAEGQVRILRAAAAWPITHGASLICPGSASYTCAAGDLILAIGEAAGVVRLMIWKADGTAVIASDSQLQPISASVGSSALTISASALALDFRSATLGSGTVTSVTGTPSNLVISSGSTLGTISGQQSRIAVLAINNAGTIELAAVNVAGGVDLSETGLISTTAEGGAGAADSASTVYSTTARTNVAYRVIGYVESTQATAGTWATAPSTIQGAGGQALATASLGNGQTWQSVTRNSGTTYYNTTGKPIVLHREFYGSGTSVKSDVSINGGSVITFLYCVIPSGFAGAVGSIVIPPGASYVITDTGGVSAVTSWELR